MHHGAGRPRETLSLSEDSYNARAGSQDSPLFLESTASGRCRSCRQSTGNHTKQQMWAEQHRKPGKLQNFADTRLSPLLCVLSMHGELRLSRSKNLFEGAMEQVLVQGHTPRLLNEAWSRASAAPETRDKESQHRLNQPMVVP